MHGSRHLAWARGSVMPGYKRPLACVRLRFYRPLHCAPVGASRCTAALRSSVSCLLRRGSVQKLHRLSVMLRPFATRPLAGGIMLRPNATLLIVTHTSPKKNYKIELLTSVVTSQHSSVGLLSHDCVRLRVCLVHSQSQPLRASIHRTLRPYISKRLRRRTSSLSATYGKNP